MGAPIAFVNRLLKETLIPIWDIPKHLPIRVHISTCHRWYTRGVRGQKLETALIGGRRFTTVEALTRFWAAISDAENKVPLRQAANDDIPPAILAAEQEMKTR